MILCDLKKPCMYIYFWAKVGIGSFLYTSFEETVEIREIGSAPISYDKNGNLEALPDKTLA